MLNDITVARQRLQEGGYTCVVLLREREYVSRERGVKPLLSLLESEQSWEGALAADKTVGAGAAYLYVLLGVNALWANVISESALQILKQHGIAVSFGDCVPYIINRRGDGMCPIEAAVADVKTPQDAYRRILDTLTQLQNRNK